MINLATILLTSALCSTSLVSAAPAQQAAAPQKAESPAARQDAGQSPKDSGQNAPKKANERPVLETQVREPFDGATVAEMSGQCVRLETEAGAIEIEMLPEAAPETVRNFLNLAATGVFDTTTFSRVVKGFVVQGGNVTTRDKLSHEILKRASRTVPDEPNPVRHERGIVSMARSDKPDSATTHFFLLVGDAPHLDGTFAAFGRVLKGMDVVDAINQAPADGEKPEKPVRVTRATVARCAQTSTPTETATPLR